MKPFYKTSLSVSTGLLFILCFTAKNSFAQYPGMGALRAQQNQQFMNQQMQRQMNMNWKTSAGQGYSYYVTFKDTTRKQVTSYMYNDTVLHKNFLILVNKKFPKSDSAHRFQKIYPDQTLNITIVTIAIDESDDAKYGLPTDSGWIFKVIGGPLSVYAKNVDYLKTIKTPLVGNPDMDLNLPSIIGIQLDGHPMEKLTKENLLIVLSNNTEASKDIEAGHYLKGITKYNKNAGKDTKK
jgi:hypothetical protein